MDPSLVAFWHEDCLLHDTGSGLFESGPSPLAAVPELHPENAERLRNVRAAVERVLGERAEWRRAPSAAADELLTIHTPAHLERVDALAALQDVTRIEGPTFASSATPAAARRAAGAALAAADVAASGEAAVAYACTRPPGHHAGPETIDGYCFFSNASLAAQRLLDRGAARVAVVDWDVHHGNGTQSCFWERGDVLAVSVHMDHRSWGRSHPENGTADELGEGEGRGATLNVPLPFGSGDRAYAAAFDEAIVPALREFRPEAIVCAAGSDPSQFDPNGRMCVSAAGFHDIGLAIRAVAGELGIGSLVITQEGGYARTYGGLCAAATLLGLLGQANTVEDPLAYLPDEGDAHAAAVSAARAAWLSARG